MTPEEKRKWHKNSSSPVPLEHSLEEKTLDFWERVMIMSAGCFLRGSFELPAFSLVEQTIVSLCMIFPLDWASRTRFWLMYLSSEQKKFAL